MTPELKSSPAAPYRWVGCIVLTPDEVQDLLRALPKQSSLSTQLRQTSQAAERLADRLNQIDHGRAA